ncbi:hypothetical protein CEXT_531751 [Caerostris extrusa]|uniref:Uncharacterized protein n=1 Tax=Caerostris extrusa TaxID=172846 RepID=A0AAV4NG18_CAEEX|nr:hypothetical protein CEXT_531751 [Caerostris extrusa]
MFRGQTVFPITMGNVRLWLLPWGSDVREDRAFMKKIASDIIDEHVRTFDPNNLRDYVDSYLNEIKNLEEKENLKKALLPWKDF